MFMRGSTGYTTVQADHARHVDNVESQMNLNGQLVPPRTLDFFFFNNPTLTDLWDARGSRH